MSCCFASSLNWNQGFPILKIAGRCEVTTEKVIREVSAVAFSDVRRLFNPDGSLKPVHELDDATAAAIAVIEVDASGVCKIKVWDKNSAHKCLCKHLGLFREEISNLLAESNVFISPVVA